MKRIIINTSILSGASMAIAMLATSGQAVAESAHVSAEPGSGFTITSPDERYSASFNTRVQMRYTYFDNDEGSDVSEFRVRRLRPALSGHVYSKDLTYQIVPEIGRGFDMLVARLNWRVSPEFQIRLGQDKAPYSREKITSSGRLSFVDRSLVDGFFEQDFPAGVMFHGYLEEMAGLDWALSITNQAGRNERSDGTTPMLMARVGINPLGQVGYAFPSAPIDGMLFAAYVNVGQNKVSPAQLDRANTSALDTAREGLIEDQGVAVGDLSNVKTRHANADVAWRWEGTSVFAEYHWMEVDPSGAGDKFKADGFYVQLGQFLTNQIEVVGRFSTVNPNQDVAGNSQDEVRVGVNYFVNGHGFKVQVDAGEIERRLPGESAIKDRELRAQLQLVF